MNTRMDNRTKGYVGSSVSGKKLADIANKLYSVQYGDASTCTVDDFLFVELKKQDAFGHPRYALVCSEGVGWEQDEYGTILVPTNLGRMSPYGGRVHISVEVIKESLTGERVDIAEYVRVFGDRLDNNVAEWQSAMSPVKEGV